MKNLFCFFSFFVFISCLNDDDNGTQITIEKKWFKDYYEKLTYNESGELISTDTDYEYQNELYLNLKSNGVAELHLPFYNDLVIGNWSFDSNSKLYTDLEVNLPNASGFTTFYYFPNQKVIELNEHQLILEKPLENFTDVNPNGTFHTFIKIKYYFVSE